MQITVNGELQNISDDLTLAAFLEERNIESQGVVVECNGLIVQEEFRKETMLSEGDVLEILQFVGGG
jgi:thiamine biosynthesis protein ThiS